MIGVGVAALSALSLLPGRASHADGFDWIGKVELHADGLRSKDPEQRLEAVRRLGKSEVRWARPHLLRALRDPDIRVAGAAGKILARGKVVQAVPIVIPWLSSTSVEAQQAAAEILGEVGDPRAIPQLVRSIGNQDPQVRVRVVNALGRIGTAAVVVPLIDRLDDDKAEVRLAAVEQLMNTRDRRAVIPLVGLFTEPSVEVRVAAITAVGRLGDRAALPALLRLLRDPNEQIKKSAVTALGNLEAAEATDTLIQMLQTGSDSFRAEVAFALGHIARSPSAGERGREALHTLVEALAHGQLRAAATEALTAAGRTAVPALIAHLQGKLDGDPATVVVLLRDIGDARATPALVNELDRGRLSRELVLDALRVMGDSRALVPVLGLVSDKDPSVRLAAMKALRPLIGKGSRAADVLGDLLDDPELEIRILAAEYLGIMSAEVAIPRLLDIAASTSAELRLRAAAVSALGDIGHRSATRQLLAILRDGPAGLQHAAANSLIYIQDPAAVGPLLDLIERAPASARASVVRTLGGVLRDRRSDRARGDLEELAVEGALDVSLSAVAALGAMADPASRETLVQLTRAGQIRSPPLGGRGAGQPGRPGGRPGHAVAHARPGAIDRRPRRGGRGLVAGQVALRERAAGAAARVPSARVRHADQRVGRVRATGRPDRRARRRRAARAPQPAGAHQRAVRRRPPAPHRGPHPRPAGSSTAIPAGWCVRRRHARSGASAAPPRRCARPRSATRARRCARPRARRWPGRSRRPRAATGASSTSWTRPAATSRSSRSRTSSPPPTAWSPRSTPTRAASPSRSASRPGPTSSLPRWRRRSSRRRPGGCRSRRPRSRAASPRAGGGRGTGAT